MDTVRDNIFGSLLLAASGQLVSTEFSRDDRLVDVYAPVEVQAFEGGLVFLRRRAFRVVRRYAGLWEQVGHASLRGTIYPGPRSANSRVTVNPSNHWSTALSMTRYHNGNEMVGWQVLIPMIRIVPELDEVPSTERAQAHYAAMRRDAVGRSWLSLLESKGISLAG